MQAMTDTEHGAARNNAFLAIAKQRRCKTRRHHHNRNGK
jgi:hypothetical protein